MANINLIRTIIGIIGNCISCGLFLSPLPTFYNIYKNKSVGDYSPNPYLCTILNCLLWVYYGLPFVHAHSTLVITINGFGCVIEFIYVCIFFAYATFGAITKKGRGYMLLVLAVIAVFYTAVVLLLSLEPHSVKNRPKIIGIVCDIVNICMYAMPLDNLYMVITTKSSESLPKWLLLFNALNGGCWLTYGLLPFDIYLVVSNGLGFVLGIIQIIVWWWFNNPKPKNQVGDPKIAAKELSMV
ncbi:hypothetical protein MKW94_019058 [Papaver nudicaule]|uniref:Bidirectional sugar transporter SWEET n=1 Tax=Papaver nudicaule TaxID=74823 RepID=A0AA41VUE1_PAPNU|nr:hypothetical protein [Papaver nudicaule]